jgi:nitrogen fixation/metabolism regulation signal transduction histidine kinase
VTRATGWTLAVTAVAVFAAGLVLTFVLSLTVDSTRLFERHGAWLIWANLAAAALLMVVVLLAAARLAVRKRQGKFGSMLLIKLAGIFALVGVLPGVLIYTVSYQFVSRSIEVWFDERVQGALDAGLELGRGTLAVLQTDLGTKTRVAADRLAETRAAPTALALERVREQLDANEVALISGSGQVLAMAVTQTQELVPTRPSPALLRLARSQRVATLVEGLDEEQPAAAVSNARIRAMARLLSVDALNTDERYLLVTQAVPSSVSANALAVQGAYREYQQRALARDGLRMMYIGTLTLTLVLAVFGGVLLAVLLGTQLARPLLLLAEGVKQVAAGDLTAKPVSTANDEIGGLTRSFAQMTEQLGHARAEVQRGVTELESARTYLQTILDSLTAGVIVFDGDRRLATVNPGATRILKLPLASYRGRPLHEVAGLEDFATAVWQRFEAFEAGTEAGERDHWQDAYVLPDPRAARAVPADGLTLLMRGAELPQGAKLLVFDDISEVVSAQRQAAWSEVARRLAHEIKNPLTPIQLSAERLQLKLESKLDAADASLLQRSVTTIVNQVQAMKQLVNEFRDYARLPAAQLAPLQLNDLVNEVAALYGQALDAQRLGLRCAASLPPIMGDATQLRQVIHNLVGNALDAIAEQPGGRAEVSTEVLRHEDGRPRGVRLSVLDNGPGFADHVLNRAFEPYVTTKSKGTGLGLAVVKKIADEHGARVRVSNLQDRDPARRGAQVSLSFSNLVPPQTSDRVPAPAA